MRSNVLANYAGQFYIAGVNVLLLPLQVSLLGAEAYGLVGFFAMLSGWLQLLDIGLTPTLARETAAYRAGALDTNSYRQLLRSVELLFLCVGLTVTLLVVALSRSISDHWLQRQALSASTVASAVSLMGVVFAFRWQATPSRSVLVGLERQVWVNTSNALFATLRSVGVLAVLRWVEASPRAFFSYQAAVAVIEFFILRIVVRRSLPFTRTAKEPWSLRPLRRVASFSMTVAVGAAVWVSITQLDDLLLSKFLPLSEYAWFTLAVMAATGINLLAAPIGQAVQPRLTYLSTVGNVAAFRTTYSEATQVLSAIALTASVTMAFGSRALLWAWTGNSELADRTAPTLAFYALGNGLLAVVAMTYYLQVARGDLRLHLKGNLAFALLQLPIIILATIRGGMLGASIAWCAANVVFFIVWSAIVHRRFLPGFHLRWLVIDVLMPASTGFLVCAAPLALVRWSSLTRLETALALAVIGGVSAGVASLATAPVRRFLRALGQKRYDRAATQAREPDAPLALLQSRKRSVTSPIALKNRSDRRNADSALITVAAGLVSISMTAVYCAARVGFDTPKLPLCKVLGLNLFLVSLPNIWRNIARRLGIERAWYATPGVGALFGLALSALAGSTSGRVSGTFVIFGVLGLLAFAVALIQAVKADAVTLLAVAAGSVAFAFWCAALAWGYGYANPLALESLATHTGAPTMVDTLFHASISNMLKSHSIASTGLDGLAPLRYHIGSHWLFAQQSKLLGIDVFLFYEFAFPVILFPMLFASLFWFASTLVEMGTDVVSRPRFGWKVWATFVVGVIGFLPLDAQTSLAIGWWRPISESYTLSLVFALGFLSACVAFYGSIDREKSSLSQPARLIFLLLFVPIGTSICGITKSSTMVLLLVLGGYAALRLKLYRQLLWVACGLLTVSLAAYTLWRMRMPEFTRVVPFHFIRAHVGDGWEPLWPLGYLLWVWLFGAARLWSLGVRSTAQLREAVLERRVIDLELLLVVAVVGCIPGLVFAIPGQSAGYFSDPQRWAALALMLAFIARQPGSVTGETKDASIVQRSGRSTAQRALAVLVAAVVLANATSLLKRFVKANLATRQALSPGAGFRASLGLDGSLQRALSSLSEYRLIEQLRRLDALPIAQKARAALFVPRVNQRFWNLLPDCSAPFVGPALSGVAMVAGLPRPDCPYFGYWTYRVRAGGWGPDPVEGADCARAAGLGLPNVYRLTAASSSAGTQLEPACGGHEQLPPMRNH